MVDGEAYDITIDESVNDIAMPAWLAYAGCHSVWIEEKFSKTFPQEKNYTFTFQEELECQQSLLIIWKQTKEHAVDQNLDDLQAIHEAGFADEYIHERFPGLSQTLPLDRGAYKAWKITKLKNRTPTILAAVFDKKRHMIPPP